MPVIVLTGLLLIPAAFLFVGAFWGKAGVIRLAMGLLGAAALLRAVWSMDQTREATAGEALHLLVALVALIAIWLTLRWDLPAQPEEEVVEHEKPYVPPAKAPPEQGADPASP